MASENMVTVTDTNFADEIGADGFAKDAATAATVAQDLLAAAGHEVVAAADGTTALVGVSTGLFADGYVEVTGNVSEGMEVVIP